jgi:cytosine deaminase
MGDLGSFFFPKAVVLWALLGLPAAPAAEGTEEIAALEAEVAALRPDSRYPHDPFILVTLQEAMAAKREGSGGVGACLAHEGSGGIVARGRNRQYVPYWRSDLDAEMDVLIRWEDGIHLLKGSANPRETGDLVLYSSMEPCPMCLTRLINTGLRKVYYAAIDPDGGMARRIDLLPPFWREAARGAVYEEAACSPAMKALARRLFRHGARAKAFAR